MPAGDAARRRVDRDLHDGAQQRLFTLGLQLSSARALIGMDSDALLNELDDAIAAVGDVLDELRAIAIGIHPKVLNEGDLRPALKAFARRCAVPVRLDVEDERRLREQISEALTSAANTPKPPSPMCPSHRMRMCCASKFGTTVAVEKRFANGSGPVALKHRVDVLGGHLLLQSPLGAGTALEITLPLDGPG